MRKLENWVARRSGARITIAGDEGGKRISITEIVQINAGTPFPIATAASGECFELLPAY